MVIVDGVLATKIHQEIDEEIANEPTQEEIEQELLNNQEGKVVFTDTHFTTSTGRVRKGFYVDSYLLNNLRNYIIKAVKKKFDGVILVTGSEGSSKTTNAGTIAKVLDPTFPGEPLNNGTTRRKCTRIVFTAQQFMEAIDNAKPQQAIVLDEAILSMMSQDSSSEIQKTLIKKMVTIRSLRLYIIIVIPSIFLLRKYLSIFRTRCLIHYYCPDGLTRGYAKVYSYETKRKLYIRGIKEFDQDCVKPDFRIRATDTSGFFYDDNEYQLKKNEAVKNITSEKESKKGIKSKTIMKYRDRCSMLLYALHEGFKLKDSKHTFQKSADMITEMGVKISLKMVNDAWLDAKKIMADKAKEIEEIAKRDALIEGYKEKLANKK